MFSLILHFKRTLHIKMFQMCGGSLYVYFFNSRPLQTAIHANVLLNLYISIYIVYAMQFTINDYISHLERLERIQFRACTLKRIL